MKVKEYYEAMREMGITYEQAIGAVKEFAETASTIKDFGIGEEYRKICGIKNSLDESDEI